MYNAVFVVQCKVCNVQCSVCCSVFGTMYSVSTVFNLQITMYSEVCSLQSTMYSDVCIVHCAV